MPCWTWVCKYVFETLLSIPLGSTQVGFLDHVAVLFLTFWGSSISIMVAPFFIPTSSVGGSQVLHILTSTCCFLFCGCVVSSHPVRLLTKQGPQVQSLVVWLVWGGICFSPVICHVEHLFMCLLTICTSSLEKGLFSLLPIFEQSCVFFCVVEFYGFSTYPGYQIPYPVTDRWFENVL